MKDEEAWVGLVMKDEEAWVGFVMKDEEAWVGLVMKDEEACIIRDEGWVGGKNVQSGMRDEKVGGMYNLG